MTSCTATRIHTSLIYRAFSLVEQPAARHVTDRLDVVNLMTMMYTYSPASPSFHPTTSRSHGPSCRRASTATPTDDDQRSYGRRWTVAQRARASDSDAGGMDWPPAPCTHRFEVVEENQACASFGTRATLVYGTRHHQQATNRGEMVTAGDGAAASPATMAAAERL